MCREQFALFLMYLNKKLIAVYITRGTHNSVDQVEINGCPSCLSVYCISHHSKRIHDWFLRTINGNCCTNSKLHLHSLPYQLYRFPHLIRFRLRTASLFDPPAILSCNKLLLACGERDTDSHAYNNPESAASKDANRKEFEVFKNFSDKSVSR